LGVPVSWAQKLWGARRPIFTLGVVCTAGHWQVFEGLRAAAGGVGPLGSLGIQSKF